VARAVLLADKTIPCPNELGPYDAPRLKRKKKNDWVRKRGLEPPRVLPKNLARELLRAVADGGEVPIAQVHDLARGIIEAPVFRVAQEILQGTSRKFAARKAAELDSMVLSSDDSAAEGVAGEMG